MAKTNWTEHAEAFIGAGDEAKAARDKYCDDHGINPNSFRRELNKYKADHGKNTVVSKKTAHKADQKPRQKADQPSKAKAPSKQSPNKSDQSKKSGSRVARSKSDQNGGTPRARARVAKDVPANIKREDGTYCFAPGNKASLLHGRYAKQLLSREEYFDFAEASIEDVHKVMKARYFGMQQISTHLIDQVIADYDAGREHVKEIFEDGELVKIPMSFEEAITSAQLTGLKEFTKLGDSIMKSQQNMQQLMIEAHQLSPYSQTKAIEITAELLDQRQKESLSATDTCLLFDRKGIKPPIILLEEAKHEIKNMAPEIDDNAGGITQEQVDAAHAASVAQRAARDKEVAAHRARIEKLVSRHANEGKMKVIGGDAVHE